MTTPRHWIGDVKPRVFRQQAKVVKEFHREIGARGDKYSVLRLKLLEPTPEYPNIYISFSLTNGANSTYSQIKPEELQDIIRTLTEWQTLFMEYMPNLSQKSAVYLANREQRDRQIAVMQEIMNAQGGEDLTPQQILQMAQMLNPSLGQVDQGGEKT